MSQKPFKFKAQLTPLDITTPYDIDDGLPFDTTLANATNLAMTIATEKAEKIGCTVVGIERMTDNLLENARKVRQFEGGKG